MANGTSASYTYDAADRLVSLKNLGLGGEAAAGFTYTYDPVGQPIQVIEADASAITWSYDPTYQLVNEDYGGGTGAGDPSAAYNTTYTYDPAGNRSLLDATGVITTTTYDAGDQIILMLADVVSPNTSTYTYDAAGNVTSILAASGAHDHVRLGRRKPQYRANAAQRQRRDECV